MIDGTSHDGAFRANNIQSSKYWAPCRAGAVDGAQSPPAAHRDDSLVTNPSAGLVTESHPHSRRRGGWGRAGVFAVVACLAWPNLAFAQDPGVTVSETELMVSEGGSASYTVVLDAQPTDDVTITVAPSSGDDENLTASPENADLHELYLEYAADGDGPGGRR